MKIIPDLVSTNAAGKVARHPSKTPNCVATIMTRDGLTSHEKKFLLWSQQIRMEVSRGLLENTRFHQQTHYWWWPDFLWKTSGFGLHKHSCKMSWCLLINIQWCHSQNAAMLTWTIKAAISPVTPPTSPRLPNVKACLIKFHKVLILKTS